MSDSLVKPNALTDKWGNYISDLPTEMELERAKDEAGFVSQWMHRFDTGSMVAKFCLGAIAYLANPDWRNNRKYGASVIEEIAEEHHINANVLREARRCAEFFGLDLDTYYDWLTEGEGVKTWTDVRKLIRAWDDPDVLGPDALADRLVLRIESAGEDLRRLQQKVHEGEIDRETYEGVRDEFIRDANAFNEVKEEALQDEVIEEIRDRDYLDFLKSHRCVATQEPAPCEPHHVAQGGEAVKGSDMAAIPLKERVHTYLENEGHRAAERKFNFSIHQALFECNHEYLFGYRPTLPPDISYRRHGERAPEHA